MVMKPANTFSVMWPASMFANSRRLCDSGRDRNDMISIRMISGMSRSGMPLGANSLKNLMPLRHKP